MDSECFDGCIVWLVQLGKVRVQMRLEPDEVVLDIWILQHVIAYESWHRRHAKEPEIHVRRKEQVVHTATLKEILVLISKRLPGRVEGYCTPVKTDQPLR